HDANRGHRAPRRRWRRAPSPQLAAWPAAGDGAGRRHDDDQGRGADGRDPHVLAGADLDDRRPRRLLDALPPLRGSADARRAEDHRADQARARRGQGLVADEEQTAEAKKDHEPPAGAETTARWTGGAKPIRSEEHTSEL